MDSTINLLPEKDKQLKREGQHKKSAESVEMTKPQDRVFQERVVRMEGLLTFFKRIFRRTPKLPQPKVKLVTPPEPPKVPQAAPKPAAPVTKMETMMDRMPKPAAVPKPPAPPSTGGFLSNMFRRAPKSPEVPSQRPTLIVPPPPARPVVAPVAAPKGPAWAPPPPPVAQKIAPPPPPPASAPVPPPLKPAFVPPPFPPQAPLRSRPKPAAPTQTEAQPMLGNSLNVNLVPEKYQPVGSPTQRKHALVIVGSVLLLLVVAIGGLEYTKHRLEQRVQLVQDEINATTLEVRSLELRTLTDAQALQQRTADVKRVLDQHVYWDAFFAKLESVTLPTVAYNTLTVDVSGTVTLSATTNAFSRVGDQLLAFQRAKDFITDATVSGATQAATVSPQDVPPDQQILDANTRVNFSASLRVDPKIFYRR